MVEHDEPDFVLFASADGTLVSRKAYCDCAKKGFGYTKRRDGAWVRPCCMRREKAAWEKWGDGPTPDDLLAQKEQHIEMLKDTLEQKRSESEQEGTRDE